MLIAAVVLASEFVEGATYQTVNFTVTADRTDVAEQVGKQAEVFRRQLAIFWLGKPLPNWSRPCRISVREGALGAGGQTTFQFVRGEVLNWRMQVQGSLERILDSVLPHEINHTIFACHFRRPLPRWADEGAATLFEHRSEQLKQLALLEQVIDNSAERISLRDLLSMKEYPRGQRAMLTLYAQGYALADFLVQQKGRQAYLKFIADGERLGWDKAIRSSFDHEGIDALERNWRGWVLAGMPKLTLPRDQMLAAAESSDDEATSDQATARPEFAGTERARATNHETSATRRRTDPKAIVRLQSPDPRQATPDVAPAARRDRVMESRNEEVDDASSTSVQGPGLVPVHRRSRVTAPMPRNREAADAGRRSGNEFLSPDENDAAGSSGDDLSSRETERLFGQSLVRDGMTATGLESRILNEGSPRRQSDDRDVSDEFDSADANPATLETLPVERSGNTGRTPQWAGFPGQSKLF